MAHPTEVIAHRGQILTFRADPGDTADGRCYEHFADGLLLIENGRIAALGPAQELSKQLPADLPVIDHGRNILMPGFIDTHIHYPQTDVIAGGGRQLLDWLNDYTFVEERRFQESAHGAGRSRIFSRRTGAQWHHHRPGFLHGARHVG